MLIRPRLLLQVAQMEIEAQTMDAQEKARIKSKVKGFKAELAWNRADLVSCSTLALLAPPYVH